jgi:hypothetical protein
MTEPTYTLRARIESVGCSTRVELALHAFVVVENESRGLGQRRCFVECESQQQQLMRQVSQRLQDQTSKIANTRSAASMQFFEYPHGYSLHRVSFVARMLGPYYRVPDR